MSKIKRALLPRQSDFTKQFSKDWERLNQSGRYDMPKLKSVMLQLIANEQPLDTIYRDHELIGN